MHKALFESAKFYSFGCFLCLISPSFIDTQLAYFSLLIICEYWIWNIKVNQNYIIKSTVINASTRNWADQLNLVRFYLSATTKNEFRTLPDFYPFYQDLPYGAFSRKLYLQNAPS